MILKDKEAYIFVSVLIYINILLYQRLYFLYLIIGVSTTHHVRVRP
jgi:hypothetical protein